MSLFKKKPTLDEILSGIYQLSDEEKEKVHAKMQDLYKAEDEREIDKIEEDKTEDPEKKDEKHEEVEEESEEIGADVDEVDEEVEDEPDTEDAEADAEDGAKSEAEGEEESEAEESEQEDPAEKGGLSEVIKDMIAATIREEVAKAFAELNKPSKEETEPHEADEDDRDSLKAVEALYNS